MKNKLRIGALVLTAVMLASSVYEAAPIVVRAEEQSVAAEATVSGGDAEEKAEESTEAVGETKPAETIAVYVTESDTPVATMPDHFRVYDDTVKFDATKDWDPLGEQQIALTTDAPLQAGAYVTMDILIPEGATFEGALKIQGIARLGSGWKWTQSNDTPEITQGDCTEATDGFYRFSVKYNFGEEITEAELRQFTLRLAGWRCTYEGDVYVENVKLYDGAKSETPEVKPGETTQDTLVAEASERRQVYEKDVTFDSKSEWSDQGEYEIGLTTQEALHEGSYLTMDVVLPKESSFHNIMKIQGVVKVGDGWKWTEGKNIPELEQKDFTVREDGTLAATIKVEFGSDVELGAVKTTLIKLAGYKCDYSGPIYIENVKLYDKQAADTPELPEKEPGVIDDFEDGSCDDWTYGGEWQYDNKVTNTVTEYNGSKMMKVDLDYTGMGGYSWSEAKLSNNFAKAFDISAYNLLSFDYYYPAAMSGSKLKIFSNSGINTEAEITEVETLDDGYIKTTAQLKFSPSDEGLADLTIGFVGVNTEFVGSVYVDNITLSQYNANADYVKITSVPGTGTQADTTGAPTEVKLSDAQAGSAATALYAYLMALRANDQVLFGHENDINKSVSGTATMGDVMEITGSVSGIYGIDSLALTGAELGISDAQAALAQAIAYSKEAAGQGAIVTLSTHMPNFTNEKIKVNADGSYDFTACDFSEAKDTSNNCAEQILPGGAYNDRFTAYLDIIADYALALQEDNIPILFRPYHENTGSWFWWGSSTSVETYKSLWRYTQEYLQSEGVHNMIYVYSPNGPLTSAEEYNTRYPGDEYVDVLAFDYYDDYSTYPATYDDGFFQNLENTCQVVSALAVAKGKVAAISETGVRVMKKDGSDYEGLLVTGNPIAGHNWYGQVSDIAAKCDMPYWLVWANFGSTNFYVPYKYNDTMGQELVNEFIDFYNSDSSIFGNGTNFYSKMQAVNGTAYDTAQGYLIAPLELATIKEATTFRASVKNAAQVNFVVTNTATGKEITLPAEKVAGSSLREYTAELTEEMLAEIGQTDTATVALVADGKVLATVKNISLGKDKEKAPANVLENFDYYAGSDGLLQSAYTENSAGGCSSDFTLSADHKSDGAFGGAFHYRLNTAKSEVWTGQVKTLEDVDLSAYNAITMWVDPDGMGQKLVVQLADNSGEEFEVYLSDFVKGTEAGYVTIPFASFKGKQNGTLNTAKITRFAIWCNSIIPENHTGDWNVDSVIYFDGVEAFTADDALLAQADANGLIITEKSPIKREEPKPEDPKQDDKTDDKTDDKNNDSKTETGSDNGNSGSSASEEVTVDWATVKAQIEAKKAAGASDNLNVIVGEETKVSADVLAILKNSNMTLALHTGEGVALSISGQDLKNTDLTNASALDLTVKRDGDRITLRDTGRFTVPVNMHLAMGNENAGKYANLYRRNAETGAWEYCGSFRITEAGQAMFGIVCGGEYRVTVTEQPVKETNVFAGGEYVVKAGDTMTKIARKHKITLAELVRKNPQIRDRNKIRVGQKIRIQ